MAIQAPSSLRMGGLHSGLDTESIVSAMTSATKFKITKQQRKVLMLEAQQEAYRDIIKDVTAFKEKYFDILKTDNCLKSRSLFSKYTTNTVQSNGAAGAPAGVTVTAGSEAIAGNYDFTVHKVATQTSVKGSSLDANQVLDFSGYIVGETYAMNVTVGSKNKVISFTVGADDDATRASLNDALLTFGTKNDGSGIVSIGSNNKINSSDRSTITTTAPVDLLAEQSFNTDFNTGSNSITLFINGESKTFSFTTVESGYFDDVFQKDGAGNLVYDDRGIPKFAELPASSDPNYADLKAKQNNFKAVVDDMYRLDYDEQYEQWSNDNNAGIGWGDITFDTASEEQKKLALAYGKLLNDNQAKTQFNSAANKVYGKEYNEYVNALKESNEDAVADDFETWLETDKGVDIELFKSGALNDEETFGKEFVKAYETYSARLNDVSGTTVQSINDMNQIMALNGEQDIFGKVYSAIGADQEMESLLFDNTSPLNGVIFKNKDNFYANSAENLSDVVDAFNKNSFVGLESLEFSDGTKIKLNWGGSTAGGDLSVSVSAYVPGEGGNPDTPVDLAATSNSGYNFGLGETDTTANTISTATTLGELKTGLSSYEFSINGVDFKFDEKTTIKQLISEVNASKAGVSMSFSTLGNGFSIAAKDYGTEGVVDFSDNLSQEDINGGAMGLLQRFGFDPNPVGRNVTQGENMVLEINGEMVEVASNSYEIDGTTITVAGNTKLPGDGSGLSFSSEVTRDYKPAIEAVKSFVEDYNKLIEKIYGFTDEKPNRKYYFLTDDEKAEMEMSEKQSEQWDKVAKQGMLYNDSTLTGMMSKIRTLLYTTASSADGGSVGLFTIGITAGSTNYMDHGKLTIDEGKLLESFRKDPDSIMRLFTDPEEGMMVKLEKLLDSYVKTTGERKDKGLLIQKAGTANSSSTLDNSIYDQIRKINTMIGSLEDRFKQQEDRYWKVFSNLETQMSNLNSQTSSISQLIGGMSSK
ncbi:MAG: flagellar filament capping protein FliD [Eubacterium sp.]|jgi:flagellar capping protein FliD|nr:flagellar filament capping protein FliD [Eubacterium sp.]